jgi:DNA-binding NtrC family response regulator
LKEAASATEAKAVLLNRDIALDVVFCAVGPTGMMDGFTLAAWVRKERPSLEVILAGTIERAAEAASDLCGQKPHLERPYQPQQVVDWIRRLRNLRTRS